MKKGLFVVLAALALVCSCKKPAAPPQEVEEPLQVSVTTGAATVVGTDRATLNGGVSVCGADASEATVSFLYSATASAAEDLESTGDAAPSAVGAGGTIQVRLEGLQEGTLYHYVAVARVRGELFYGTVESFRTRCSEVVDLGLSVKWRAWNLGAAWPWEYGSHYAWGETELKADYSWQTYAWGDIHYDEEQRKIVGTLTKYCPSGWAEYWAGDGDPDGKAVLEPGDDAAVMCLGGGWRMPTMDEWEELRDNCTLAWTAMGGVNGRKVTSNKPGYTNRWIFLPAAGLRDGADPGNVGSYGSYGSSSLHTGSPDDAQFLGFDSGSVYGSSRRRCVGLSVRPVLAL